MVELGEKQETKNVKLPRNAGSASEKAWTTERHATIHSTSSSVAVMLKGLLNEALSSYCYKLEAHIL